MVFFCLSELSLKLQRNCLIALLLGSVNGHGELIACALNTAFYFGLCCRGIIQHFWKKKSSIMTVNHTWHCNNTATWKVLLAI